MVVVDRPRNRRPRLLQHQHTLHVIALKLLARLRVENRGLDTEERHSRRSGFRLDRTGERSDDDRPRLGLPERINDGALLPPDVFVVPVPRLGVDGLADGAKHPQRRQVMAFNVLVTKAAKQTDGSRRRVELGDAVLLNCLPIARGSRVDGSRLENGRSHAVRKGTVDDVTAGTTAVNEMFAHTSTENSRMTCDPPNIGHAGELVVRVHIEYIFDRHGRAEQIPASGMDDSLWLTGGTRRLEITTIAPIKISGSIYIQNEGYS